MKKLSIVSITYNQEKYIREALDSFLTQKTNFDFEVIISDDCSSDNTRSILKEYQEEYPNIFKVFYQEKNIGALENYIFALTKAKTEYVIVNEGDDYFTDPYKLQKQVDYLESHPECAICFHPVEVKFENKERVDYIFPKTRDINNFTFEKLLFRNFIQTNSVMYRWQYVDKDIRDDFPDNILPGDWYLHLLHAQKGKIGFIDEVMSVYRRHDGGIWYDTLDNLDLHFLKHGERQCYFCANVYEKISNKNEKYLNEELLPMFQNVLNAYFVNKRFDKLGILESKYPIYVDKAMEIQKNKGSVISTKCKKYKKWFNILLITAIVETILLLLFLSIEILR